MFHEKQRVEGVTTISNYISTEDKTIAGRTVPSGSWIKELMITDEDIIEMIKSNQLNGVSPNFRLHANATCLKEVQDVKGNLFYNKDIENKECMKPVFLSLVDEPANEYGLEVYSYEKYLEKSKSKNGGKPMVNKFKEMLKSFGESVVNYADGMDESESEETEEVEMEKADETAQTESNTEESTAASTEESTSSDGNVLSEENSFEEITDKVRMAVTEKYFTDDEGVKTYVGIALTFSDAVVIQDWDNDKYFKVDYSIDGDTVTLGELQEVEMKYVVKGSEETSTEETTTETTTEAAAESQKSKQPQIKMSKIRVNEEKLDDTELEKGKEARTNHLGFPIKTTKELAKSKNVFNF